MYEVTVRRTFSAAHRLQEIGGGCEDLHGHNFSVEVSVEGDGLTECGLVLDFRVLKEWTDECLANLDHKYLNEVEQFRGLNPSSENIARFLHERIGEKARMQGLRVSRVTVRESENAWVTYMETGTAS